MVIYDYIFCGLGLSSLMVLDELADNDILKNSSVLILNSDEISAKTWCFWENNEGKWDSVLANSWTRGFFTDGERDREILDGLVYKCLDSKEFHMHQMQKLSAYANLTFKKEKVLNWTDDGNFVSVITENESYSAKKFINSGFRKENDFQNYKVLVQHFEGWFIESKQLPFDPDSAIIMDFSVPQKSNTRFMYVLPFSKTSALIEYTLFSPQLIDKDEYEKEIISYLDKKGINEFKIIKKETGVIPMTAYPLWKQNTKNVLHIGTVGGWTKPSTGYTFNNAQQLAKKLAVYLTEKEPDFTNFHKTSRYYWYDKLFIDVLYRDNSIGKRLFSKLFFQSKGNQVMKFLKEQSSFASELKIILACPKKPFLKALFATIFKENRQL